MFLFSLGEAAFAGDTSDGVPGRRGDAGGRTGDAGFDWFRLKEERPTVVVEGVDEDDDESKYEEMEKEHLLERTSPQLQKLEPKK